MKQRVLSLIKSHKTLFIYGVIGLSGAILDLIFYFLFYRFVGIPPVIASFLSVSIGIINNFLLNSRHNFKVSDKLFFRFINFYSIGLGGAILSSVIILILFNGLGIDAMVAKIITIVPVVLLQYFLNKKISFGNLSKENYSNHPLRVALTRHYWLLIINAIFVIMGLVFITHIQPEGPNTAPDEGTHFNWNVKFIIDHKQLPVSGEDDIPLLQACRDTTWGKVPCTYSYQAYPGANYVFAAGVSWIMHEITGVSYLNGARLAALFWGVAFINLLYFMVLRVTRNPNISAIITASVAFIPQVIFSASYVNQDAHSLAIGALVGYALIRFIQDQRVSSYIIAGIAFGGLLPLAKFNYFLLCFMVAAVLIVAVIYKKISWQHIGKLALWCLAGFIVFAGFWYGRNIMLYHDPLGQSFTLHAMSAYHELGQAKDFSLVTLQESTRLGFFETLFRSFFLAFGPMSYYLDGPVYAIVSFCLFALIFIFFYICTLVSPATRKYAIIVFGSVILFILMALGLVYQNATVYDFQPQGRYLFPILIPITLGLAFLYRLDKKFRFILFGFLLVTLYVFFSSFDVIIKNIL